MFCFFFFFFFSSRRRHTRLTCDWSSDVCSSDLVLLAPILGELVEPVVEGGDEMTPLNDRQCLGLCLGARDEGCRDRRRQPRRSEERRVGKECRSRWSPDH